MNYVTLILISFVILEGLFLAFRPQQLKDIINETPAEMLSIAGIMEVILAIVLIILASSL